MSKIKKTKYEKEARANAAKVEQARRREMINNGVWMGRPSVFKSKAKYDRKESKDDLRKTIQDN